MSGRGSTRSVGAGEAMTPERDDDPNPEADGPKLRSSDNVSTHLSGTKALIDLEGVAISFERSPEWR